MDNTYIHIAIYKSDMESKDFYSFILYCSAKLKSRTTGAIYLCAFLCVPQKLRGSIA